jgi:hypothetical protein
MNYGNTWDSKKISPTNKCMNVNVKEPSIFTQHKKNSYKKQTYQLPAKGENDIHIFSVAESCNNLAVSWLLKIK